MIYLAILATCSHTHTHTIQVTVCLTYNFIIYQSTTQLWFIVVLGIELVTFDGSGMKAVCLHNNSAISAALRFFFF